MKKHLSLLFLVVLIVLMQIFPAFAAEPTNVNAEIWDKLAAKALFIGKGLQTSGYLIAGIGLIFFSFLALFNKISWKTLAYIMLSCFVLGTMFMVIDYFSDGKHEMQFEELENSADANPGNKTNTPGGAVEVPKDEKLPK